jgi:uncharacterized membrane protein
MQRTRPASLTVIAVLNFVFGGLGLIGGLLGLVFVMIGMDKMFMNMGNMNPGNNPQVAKQLEQQQALQKDIMKFAEQTNPRWYQVATTSQNIVLSIMMILGGIGLLKVQSWGRNLCLTYATLSILCHIGVLIYTFLVVVPAMHALTQQMGAKGGQAKLMSFGMEFGGYVGMASPFVMMIYPVIVLIVMFRPNVVAAFRGEAAPPAEDSAASEHIQEDDRWGKG